VIQLCTGRGEGDALSCPTPKGVSRVEEASTGAMDPTSRGIAVAHISQTPVLGEHLARESVWSTTGDVDYPWQLPWMANAGVCV